MRVNEPRKRRRGKKKKRVDVGRGKEASVVKAKKKSVVPTAVPISFIFSFQWRRREGKGRGGKKTFSGLSAVTGRPPSALRLSLLLSCSLFPRPGRRRERRGGGAEEERDEGKHAVVSLLLVWAPNVPAVVRRMRLSFAAVLTNKGEGKKGKERCDPGRGIGLFYLA